MSTDRLAHRPVSTSTASSTATSTELKPQVRNDGNERAPAAPDVQTEGAELSPEAAAAAQATWGNDMVQAATRAGANGLDGAGTEASQEVETGTAQEEVQETTKDVEAARGNTATTSGSGLGTPRAIEVEAPWSAGRWFGGEDDAGAGAPAPVAGWIPPPSSYDLEEAAAEEAGGEVDPDPEDEPLDFAAARAALGEAPLPADLLNLGLRHAESLGAADFDATVLALLPARSAFTRARHALRFLADAGPPDIAAVATLIVGAGEAVGPAAGGLAGATARAIGQLQLLLTVAPSGWRSVVEVVLQTSARPRAELAAAALGDLRRLSATTLWAMVTSPEDGEAYDLLPAGAHPAAHAALARVAALTPLPDVVFPRPLDTTPSPDDALDADPWARLLHDWTSGPEAAEPSYAAIHTRWDALLAALGERHVAVAAAAVAVSSVADPTDPAAERPPDALIGSILQRYVRALRRAVAPALAAADDAQHAGTYDRHVAACVALAEARLVVHELTDLTLDALAASLLPASTPETPLPDAVGEAIDTARNVLRAGRGHLAGVALDAAIEGLRAAGLPEGLALALTSVRGALALAQADAGPALTAGTILAEVLDAPFAAADGALLLAAAGAWRSPLEGAAGRFVRDGEGGALHLLVAGWAEQARRHAT